VEEMKRRSVALIITTCLLGLAGCSGNQKNSATDTVKRNFNVTTTNNQNSIILNDTNQKLRISTLASKSVEHMKAVDQAQVIIRNNDAYVAVRLKNGTGTTGIGGYGTNAGTTGTTRTSYNSNNPGMYGNGYNSGGTGTTGLEGNNRFNTGMYGNGYNSGATGTTGVDGNKNNAGVTGIGGPGNNSRTTGLRGNNYSEFSSPLEKKIADRVRAVEKNIDTVYVSINPDFYNQMTTYSNNIRNGQNRDGLLNDFSNTVRRFFR
jgi:hypothetical protein